MLTLLGMPDYLYDSECVCVLDQMQVCLNMSPDCPASIFHCKRLWHNQCCFFIEPLFKKITKKQTTKEQNLKPSRDQARPTITQHCFSHLPSDHGLQIKPNTTGNANHSQLCGLRSSTHLWQGEKIEEIRRRNKRMRLALITALCKLSALLATSASIQGLKTHTYILAFFSPFFLIFFGKKKRK